MLILVSGKLSPLRLGMGFGLGLGSELGLGTIFLGNNCPRTANIMIVLKYEKLVS